MRKAKYTANGQTRESKKLYADFYDHQNIRRMLPLFADPENSKEAARAIDRLVTIRASDDAPSLELRRFIENTLPRIRKKLVAWDIIDASLASSTELLEELILKWRKAADRQRRR